jgi:protein tyrosine phosphatase (PTP) superfamily phosphohydrolase (DUF442 family)
MSNLLTAIVGLPNAAEPIPGVVTGGQPTAAHLAALRAAGCDVIIDSRDPMEPRSIDEPAAVRAAGMEYVSLPIVRGAATVDTMKRVHEVLRGLKGKKALLHCASGNRTAAAMIPYLMLDQGMDEQAAVETAIRIGMRSAELMELALEYTRRLGGSASA